jgi:CHRD domain
MGKLARTGFALVVIIGLLGVGSYAIAGGGRAFNERLDNYQEVPSVSSVANGEFTARISNNDSSIAWTLSYADLEGAVQQAHIHFAQRSVNGGISVFLCTNLGNGPVGTQPCPAPPATISGTITAADVSPPIPATAAARAQGIDTGELAELIEAMRAGVTYANVHSTKFPGGEIRAQLKDPGNGNN